jgi:hypothetical protein
MISVFLRNCVAYIWGLVALFFSSIFDGAGGENERAGEDREEKVRQDLNKWQVDTYARNSYLQKIPETRIRQKREELRRRYGLE